MCTYQQLSFVNTTWLSFTPGSVFLLTPAGFHTGLALRGIVDGKTVCQHLQVGEFTLFFFFVFITVCPFFQRLCRHDVLYNMQNNVKTNIHQNMKLVINLHVSPWKLSSPGPMTHSALIHHCQQQPVLFGSSAPVCPPPSLTHCPPIYSHLYLVLLAGGGHRILRDKLAVFNQELMLIAPPPLTPLLVSSILGAVRRLYLLYFLFLRMLSGTPVWVHWLVLQKC